MSALLTWLERDDLRRGRACLDARNWVAAQPDATVADLVERCPRGDWLLWIARHAGAPIPEAAYRPTVLRALRVHAPAELRRAVEAGADRGLLDHAEMLAALPDDVAWAEVAARAAVWRTETTAWAAAAVEAAAWSTEWAAAWHASWAAGTAAAWAEEHARCADEVRAAMGAEIVAAVARAVSP